MQDNGRDHHGKSLRYGLISRKDTDTDMNSTMTTVRDSQKAVW